MGQIFEADGCNNKKLDDQILSEQVFGQVIQDPVIAKAMEDLDVGLGTELNGHGVAVLFDIFDTDEDGLVSLAEFLDTLMRMRGEPQKSDVIAAWVALRSLSGKMERFEEASLAGQQNLLRMVSSYLEPAERAAAGGTPVGSKSA